MIAFLKSHKRAIVPALATAWTVFLLVHPDEWGRVIDLCFFALFSMLVASQFFWFGRILGLAEWVLSGDPRRGWFASMGCVLYLFVFIQCSIVLAGLLIFVTFLLTHPDALVDSVDQSFFVCFVMVFASQYFLIRRVLDVGERALPGKPRPAWLAGAAGLLCTYVLIQGHPWRGSLTSPDPGPVDTRLSTILTLGSFWWWLVGSWVSFILVMVFWTVARMARGASWVYRRALVLAVAPAAQETPAAVAQDPPSSSRRRFLEQTGIAVSALPFAAAAYGLVFERVAFEVTRRSIRLARLPKAFEGFRIVQLSDIHISPFMPAGEIRHCVTMANALGADLVVMTGDYLEDNAGAQSEVVQALAGLHAPHGVYGCLGNHESYTETEDSITRLFAAKGIRILRQERTPIQLGQEAMNLIGIDDPRGETETDWKRDLCRRLHKGLVMPGTVNILLAHEPLEFLFDRVVELGIDLTLAGHTHGGQLSLEFLRRGLSLSRFQSPYVSGWYEKSGSQLYVNRGIGTSAFPIRFGARPEITVLELT